MADAIRRVGLTAKRGLGAASGVLPSPPSTTRRSHAFGRSSRATVGRPAVARDDLPNACDLLVVLGGDGSTPDAAPRPRFAVSPTRLIASAMSQVQEELAVAFGAGNRRLGHR